ncbi:hypothetical protein BJ508DRAFT_322753 [Ascobolus immersus RN42]|uniref:CCR4-NOT transcription complex subunit 11 n=1 Tax=Ascobolus immersus RN42 TaxID=1160509 RepID=A0A3N4IHJ4_ASCIM|nr:hypothetical protein BJ508DRAFT_322753 [Ascobolus immersus RN42]
MAITGQELHNPTIRPFFRLADADIPIDLCSWLEEVDEYFEALENNGTEFSFSDGSYSDVDWEEEEDAFIDRLKGKQVDPKEKDEQKPTGQSEYSLQQDPAAKRIYRRLLLQLLWPLSDPDISLLQVYENTKVVDPDYHQTDFHRKIDLWRALSVIRKQLDLVKGDNCRLQSMRLNIEFYLYKSFEEEYEGYAIARNPFMIHWLEFIDGEITNPEDRTLVYFIRGLLKGDAHKFEKATPREIITNTDWKYDLETKAFRKKLSNYDLSPPRVPGHKVTENDVPFDREAAAEKTAELKKLEEAFASEFQMNGGGEVGGPTIKPRTIRTARSTKPTVNTGTKQDMAYTSDYSQDGGANTFSPSSRSPTSSSTSVDGLDCANSPIHNLLYQIALAVSSPRTAKEKEPILEHLKRQPEDLYETDFLFFDESFSSMLEVNKDLANFLLRTYLFAIPQDKIDSNKRADCLVHISRLPVTIFSLELITNLLVPDPDPKSDLDRKILEPDMAHLLLHRFLANTLRALEEANSMGTLATRKRGVTEKVSKLCVMIRNLMAKGFIVNRGTRPYAEIAGAGDDDDGGSIEYGFDNYFYEMQELGLKFVFVKEARKVWESYRKGGGSGVVNGVKGKGKEKERVRLEAGPGPGGPVPMRTMKNGVLSDVD